MAAGHAGMSEVFTPAVADALFARGEALRARLNGAAAAAGVAAMWTGLGSLATVHFGLAAPPICPAEAAAAEKDATELCFLDLLARGFYLARRGMIALSLDIGDAEGDAFVAAWSAFLADNADVLRR
jgi:glutamate-1-semialdehyde 2,1-aminomutase